MCSQVGAKPVRASDCGHEDTGHIRRRSMVGAPDVRAPEILAALLLILGAGGGLERREAAQAIFE
jgi:hypothetical protein